MSVVVRLKNMDLCAGIILNSSSSSTVLVQYHYFTLTVRDLVTSVLFPDLKYLHGIHPRDVIECSCLTVSSSGVRYEPTRVCHSALALASNSRVAH